MFDHEYETTQIKKEMRWYQAHLLGTKEELAKFKSSHREMSDRIRYLEADNLRLKTALNLHLNLSAK